MMDCGPVNGPDSWATHPPIDNGASAIQFWRDGLLLGKYLRRGLPVWIEQQRAVVAAAQTEAARIEETATLELLEQTAGRLEEAHQSGIDYENGRTFDREESGNDQARTI